MTYPTLAETVASISELKVNPMKVVVKAVIAVGKRDRNAVYEIALSRLSERQ
jgi:hypothetical protein